VWSRAPMPAAKAARPREAQYLYLTTMGRRTGRPREIEIWFTRREGRLYLIAEHRERARWVQNLRALPRVTVRLGKRTFPARGRVIDARAEPELARAVKGLSEKKYGWGDGLVVELTPRERRA
jgi:deazaflavin-dependent oxidoreductase (nitroreductase family)